MKITTEQSTKRGMQDVFLFHKNLVPSGRDFSSAMKSLINPMD